MTVEVDAVVVTGRGMAAKLRSSDTTELSKLLGLTLVSGSLNLVAKKPLWLNSKLAVLSTEQGHLYWKATLEGLPVIVNRWKGDCPAHIYEIYADVRLREALNLHDNGKVRLSLDELIVDNHTSKSFLHIISWCLTWRYREKKYYRSNEYLKWVKRKPISKFTWRSVQM